MSAIDDLPQAYRDALPKICQDVWSDPGAHHPKDRERIRSVLQQLIVDSTPTATPDQLRAAVVANLEQDGRSKDPGKFADSIAELYRELLAGS